MARFRLSGPAKADIAAILKRSEELHGEDARIRYRDWLLAAMRRVAAEPKGPSTIDRTELVQGVRSFHIRHSRDESREPPVASPVHIIFYRLAGMSIIEVVRVLHERMEPRRHLGEQK